MLFAPIALSEHKFTREELKKDHGTLHKFGQGGVGQRVIYLNGFFFDRLYYIPIKNVERVYKRLAVSKGAFESGKVFMTIAYLVVIYDGGKQKVCRFTHEEYVDMMLEYIKKHTGIPVGKK